MIYLATALYAEAAPFIRALELKKQETNHRFQLFASDTHRLIITGTGNLAAAIADTWMLTQYPPDPRQDVFAQIGTCCGQTAIGSLYLCHKLTDNTTGHHQYPDMLYHSDFQEASLITFAGIQATPPAAGALADMEGYGGYEAALNFFPPHRIFTWKVISDQGLAPETADHPILSASDLTALITPHVTQILNWLEHLPSAVSVSDLPLEHIYTTLVDYFHYSRTQQLQLRQLLHYATLAGLEPDVLLTMIPDPDTIHPAQIKKEGKRILHELEQRILS